MKHVVAEAGSSTEALQVLKRNDFDLIVMEIALGARSILEGSFDRSAHDGAAGFDLLEIIRSFSRYVPVIVLSNMNRTEDELACIRFGADTFLRKPSEMNLLTAYVRANLNRREMMRALEQAGQYNAVEPGLNRSPQTDKLIHAGDLMIDKKSRLVHVGAGAYQQLSDKEMQLLTLMASNPGKVFSKNELIDKIWGEDVEFGHHAVDSTIKRLRKKIEPVPGKPKFLLNSRGLGYRFVVSSSDFPAQEAMGAGM
jgi:DNA-binding response OmpR family regulator